MRRTGCAPTTPPQRAGARPVPIRGRCHQPADPGLSGQTAALIPRIPAQEKPKAVRPRLFLFCMGFYEKNRVRTRHTAAKNRSQTAVSRAYRTTPERANRMRWSARLRYSSASAVSSAARSRSPQRQPTQITPAQNSTSGRPAARINRSRTSAGRCSTPSSLNESTI